MTAAASLLILALLALRQPSIASLSGYAQPWPIIQIGFISVMVGLAFALPRRRSSRAVLCTLIALGCAAIYEYRPELRAVAEEILTLPFPGRPDARLVQIEHGSAANLALTAQINGAQIAMVLDTGATSVVLTQDAAKAAGLPVEVLTYSVTVDTANGRSRAAAVTLDKIAVGGIVERAVPALILPSGQLRTSLLGMSFLSRLQSWEVRGERLLIRGYP